MSPGHEPERPITSWREVRCGDTVRLKDGRTVLVGDVNVLGGECDDCRAPDPVAVIYPMPPDAPVVWGDWKTCPACGSDDPQKLVLPCFRESKSGKMSCHGFHFPDMNPVKQRGPANDASEGDAVRVARERWEACVRRTNTLESDRATRCTGPHGLACANEMEASKAYRSAILAAERGAGDRGEANRG